MSKYRDERKQLRQSVVTSYYIYTTTNPTFKITSYQSSIADEKTSIVGSNWFTITNRTGTDVVTLYFDTNLYTDGDVSLIYQVYPNRLSEVTKTNPVDFSDFKLVKVADDRYGTPTSISLPVHSFMIAFALTTYSNGIIEI